MGRAAILAAPPADSARRGATVADYVQVGFAPAFGGLCQAWVEKQLLGHTGVYANPLDALARSPDAVRTSDPSAIPPHVEVIFGAAQSNNYQGHAGISQGNGQMVSVWTNGNVEQEDIARFASDNGAPLIGWQDFGLGAVAPAGASSSSTPAATTTLPAVFAGWPQWMRWVGVGVAGLLAAGFIDALDD